MPEAVEVLRQASVLATDDNGIREHLAFAMFYNKQYRDASNLFTRLLKDPANQKRAELYLALGECQLQLHKPADARASFESARSTRRDQPGRFHRPGEVRAGAERPAPRRPCRSQGDGARCEII